MPASTTSKVLKEPTLDISDFNIPNEQNDVDMYIELITSLIFLEKGTYSEDPDCGVHIKKYEYADLIRDSRPLQDEIARQCNRYLPDIPIGNIEVTSFYWAERNIYVVQIQVSFIEGSLVTKRTISITSEDKVLTEVISKFDEK